VEAGQAPKLFALFAFRAPGSLVTWESSYGHGRSQIVDIDGKRADGLSTSPLPASYFNPEKAASFDVSNSFAPIVAANSMTLCNSAIFNVNFNYEHL
jgi:hypothetical protein